MLAIAAAIIFAIAFVLKATGTATNQSSRPRACCSSGSPAWPCTRRASARVGPSPRPKALRVADPRALAQG
jgi:hypothetical protein